MSEIILNYNDPLIQNKMKKKNSLLDELEDLDSSMQSPSLISTYKPKKEKSEVDQLSEVDDMGDDWLRTIATFKNTPVKAKKRRSDSIEELFSGGKKKKKKKKKAESELTDFNREFEHEENIYRNLLQEQTQFVSSLQQRYDAMDNAKSSARGIGKFTTDLIVSINQGRNTSLQIANALTSLKKSKIELAMKEKKEKGATAGLDDENIAQFSANFLNQMLAQDRKKLTDYGDATPVDIYDDDEMFDDISEELKDSDRPDEINKYLQYENRGVTIRALVDKEDKTKYRMQAVDKDGIVIDDYPLPNVTSLDINEGTGIATDQYRTRYEIEWQ